MRDGPDIARIASLVGDPARAQMLTALLTGSALTASELALEAGVTLQTASSHLAKLGDGGLVSVTKQGRHRYYRLSEPRVAAMLEAIMGVAELTGPKRTRPGPRDEALREARVCYDHLAGEAGVKLFESLLARNYIEDGDGELAVTESGEAFLGTAGIDVPALRHARRPVCRACLDWSVRRSHLAGSLGAALMDRIVANGWARRDGDSRVIRFSPRGRQAFDRLCEAGE